MVSNNNLNTKHKIDYSILSDISNRIFTGQIQQKDAVKELGVPSTTIRHWLKRLGLPAAKNPELAIWPNNISRADVYRAYSELLKGSSYVELLRKYRVHLRQVFERLGFDLPVRQKTPPLFCPPTDKNVVAYIAGVFDAEGTIVGPRGDYSSYTVNVSNTYRPLIDFLLSFGGRITTVIPKPNQISKKVQYRWEFCSRKDVLCFLETLLPYLKIRHKRAAIVIQHLKLLMKNKHGQ